MPEWDAEIRKVLDIAIQLRDPKRKRLGSHDSDYGRDRTPEEQDLVELWLQRRKIEQAKEEAAYKAEVLKAAAILREQLKALGEKPCA